jgi:hypothetical protein
MTTDPVELMAQHIVDALRAGRTVTLGHALHPDVMPRVRQILAGDTLPRYENPDD